MCKVNGTVTEENGMIKSDEKLQDNSVVNISQDNPIAEDILEQDDYHHGCDITTTKLPSKDFGVEVDTKYKFYKLIKSNE